MSPTSYLTAPPRDQKGLVEDWLGAGNRARTGDPQLGRLMLYQLSYSRAKSNSVGSPGGEVNRLFGARVIPDLPWTAQSRNVVGRL